ncbi:MAG: PQQ-binding-like beta-propeller repeat protein [Paracoccaceae bacterium]
MDMEADGNFVTADTATKLPDAAAGSVVVCGSHAGLYVGYLMAKAGVRAVILCDAGIGLDDAGVGSLPYLVEHGVAAAAVSHLSCRIGDVGDMLARGRISRVNALGAALGVKPGDDVAGAAARLGGAKGATVAPAPVGEGRSWVDQPGARRIALLDSAAMVGPEDAGQIVVTGSHGGLVGGDPKMALRTEAFAAAFNDAGIGIENAGLARLPALDARGIAAIALAAGSCWIGDARSGFESGVISAVNRIAAVVRLVPSEQFEAHRKENQSWETTRQRGAAFAMSRQFLRSPSGLPCNPPPFGTLTSIDAATGQLRWEVPLGTLPLPGAQPEWGSINLGGPVVTAGGLVFIGASFDPAIRAFDVSTGQELWRGELPASARSTPMTFVGPGGKQYVVIAAGGHTPAFGKLDNAVVAFALP